MFSSMTAAEMFRLTGDVSTDQLEELLEKEAQLEAISGVEAHIEEAQAQYPAEDFLTPIEKRLNALSKKLRGDNREALLAIIDALGDVAQQTFNASDYGRDELRKALEALK